MRLDLKRALDFWVGRILLALLRAVDVAVGFVVRRNHAIHPVRRVLFAKFQGIGSLVICKPAIADLRFAFPEARFVFWGTPALAELAREMPEFDEILVLDDRNLLTACVSTMTALVKTWRTPIDWAFDLEVYSRLSSVLVTLTCARNRAGFALEQLRSRRVHTHLVYFNRYRYVGEAYARLLGQLTPGSTHDGHDYDFGSWNFALDPLPDVPRPYFVFNIHAGDLSLERRWPLTSFRYLIAGTLERWPKATAVLIGHGEREVYYSSLIERSERVLDLSGKLSMQETTRLMANADLVVSNDTGPLHLALATQAPVVGLFGPTRGDTYVPPHRPRTMVLQESIYCSPCVHHWEPPPCGGDNQCMKRLSPARVLAACEALLGLPASHRKDVEVDLAMHRESLGTSREDAPPTSPSRYYPGVVYSRPER